MEIQPQSNIAFQTVTISINNAYIPRDCTIVAMIFREVQGRTFKHCQTSDSRVIPASTKCSLNWVLPSLFLETPYKYYIYLECDSDIVKSLGDASHLKEGITFHLPSNE